jgi:pimeloyl-ACP methyl ester carboxylesterase
LGFITKFSFSREADKRMIQLASERLAETPSSILGSDFIACTEFDVHGQLNEMSPPALVICGEEDKMMPVSCSQILVENIPNARIEIIPETGHMVMLEKPEMVRNLVEEFLEQMNKDP